MELLGKIAFVTGGSRGMGAAIARELAKRGGSVALTYHLAADAAREVVAEIEAAGSSAVAIQADHGGDHGTEQAISAAINHFGRIDILVNSAGIFPFAPIEETEIEEFDRTFAIHVRAPYRAIQMVLPAMSKGGRIISIGSSLGTHVPSAGVSLYAASKSALVGMTKALARELGPREITVNLVNPGSIDTDMNPADGPQADSERALIPLSRYGRAEEIAQAVAFLASPSAAFISGAILAVDGGATA